ncbi:hypothetical protein V5799_022062 [Amblyomma americanum]|uniref:Monocarboxylate transporter n=1 Tax=Amblyomma americanum TaxID=6943 RepID=A0AAQ4FNZ2_AMBAM
MLYFQKYRAVAGSFIYASWSISGIVGQFVFARLVDTYALEGALLILGGVLMHATPIVMLARNPNFLHCNSTRSEESLPTTLTTAANSAETTSNGASHRKDGILESGEDRSLKPPDIGFLRHAVALLRSPAFYILMVTTSTADYTYVEFAKTIVDYGNDKGLELDKATQLITYSSVGQLVGRVVVPFLADVRPALRGPLYALSFLAMFACLTALPHASSFPFVVALAVLVGIAQGYIMCIKYVIVAEFVGVERTSFCGGIEGAILIPVSLVSPLITGHFRDGQGSYDNYYRMLGTINAAAALLFSPLFLWNQCRK